MRVGKRFGLSAEQKSEMWRRWKAGQTLHEIGALSAKSIPPFAVWCRVTVGLLRPSGGVRSSRFSLIGTLAKMWHTSTTHK